MWGIEGEGERQISTPVEGREGSEHVKKANEWGNKKKEASSQISASFTCFRGLGLFAFIVLSSPSSTCPPAIHPHTLNKSTAAFLQSLNKSIQCLLRVRCLARTKTEVTAAFVRIEMRDARRVSGVRSNQLSIEIPQPRGESGQSKSEGTCSPPPFLSC